MVPRQAIADSQNAKAMGTGEVLEPQSQLRRKEIISSNHAVTNKQSLNLKGPPRTTNLRTFVLVVMASSHFQTNQLCFHVRLQAAWLYETDAVLQSVSAAFQQDFKAMRRATEQDANGFITQVRVNLTSVSFDTQRKCVGANKRNVHCFQILVESLSEQGLRKEAEKALKRSIDTARWVQKLSALVVCFSFESSFGTKTVHSEFRQKCKTQPDQLSLFRGKSSRLACLLQLCHMSYEQLQVRITTDCKSCEAEFFPDTASCESNSQILVSAP